MELIQGRTPKLPRPRLGSAGFLCTLLALTFATAASAKMYRFDELQSTLIASRLVPVLLARLAATALIVLELALAVSLCVPRMRSTALQTAALLLCVFIGYSAWRWWQNIPVPCHCFGTLFAIAPWQAILLDLVLLGLIASLLGRVDTGSRHGSVSAAAIDSVTAAQSRASLISPEEFHVTWEELFP